MAVSALTAAIALIILFRRRHYYMPCVGGNPNFARTHDSVSVARAYRKHAGTRILTGIDNRLHVRNCQSLGRSLDTFSTNCPWYYWFGGILPSVYILVRLHGWYRRTFPAILVALVLVPMAALLGFAEVG